MRKVLACVLTLVVGLALLQLAGCKKSEPTTGKPEQPGGTAKPEQPGTAAKADPLAAAGKRLVGVWKGKLPMPPGAEKVAPKGPPMDMSMTVEFNDGGTMSVSAMGHTEKGTWQVVKAEGNKLTVNTAGEESQFGGEMKGKEKGAKPPQEPEVLSIVFQTDDKISMGPTKNPNETMTLDRQK
jgi:hypothetical protein